jgi:hypothetical protein
MPETITVKLKLGDVLAVERLLDFVAEVTHHAIATGDKVLLAKCQKVGEDMVGVTCE